MDSEERMYRDSEQELKDLSFEYALEWSRENPDKVWERFQSRYSNMFAKEPGDEVGCYTIATLEEFFNHNIEDEDASPGKKQELEKVWKYIDE